MSNLGSETQEMDLRIQWSLITRIKAAGKEYKAGSASELGGSLRGYLEALEKLADYVATRCRGAELFQEVQASEPHPAERPVKARKRGPKLIPIAAPQEEVAYTATAGDVSLAG